MSINTITVSGNLGQEPAMKYLDDGNAIVSGTIDVRKNKEHSIWLSYKAFKKTAELIGEYCHKGNTVTLSGSLDIEEWETKDGQKRQKTVVIVNQVQLPAKTE